MGNCECREIEPEGFCTTRRRRMTVLANCHVIAASNEAVERRHCSVPHSLTLTHTLLHSTPSQPCTADCHAMPCAAKPCAVAAAWIDRLGMEGWMVTCPRKPWPGPWSSPTDDDNNTMIDKTAFIGKPKMHLRGKNPGPKVCKTRNLNLSLGSALGPPDLQPQSDVLRQRSEPIAVHNRGYNLNHGPWNMTLVGKHGRVAALTRL
ncbi:hypothetical protein EDB81DRAFT_15478 [Dactylonectria macrodidyma]|uniref:Uncharacterized protein n=1 Tax=Dactylonectria macrodidyma TaxID=307937 RepID=A0A9P9FR07_9HYPO|nr:hypothetical protein EDB81DRAFT_15478 [Dactylonectria macrodidyma]